MRSFFSKCLRWLWPLICLGTWIGTGFYRPSTGAVLITTGVFFALWGALALLSKRPYFAFSASTLILLFFTLLSKLKEFFWKEKLFFTDFQIFLDPANTETVMHYPWALAGFVIVSLLLVLIAVAGFRHARRYPGTPLPALLSLVLGVGLCFWSVHSYQPTWVVTLPKGQNVPTNVIMSVRITYQNPADTITADAGAFLAAQQQLEPSALQTRAQKLPLPDIVLLLQESTFNPALVGDVASGMPELGMFAPRERQAEGLLRVHTYGGGTWRSEFAALTGLSSDDFGVQAGAIYYSAVFHLNQALFAELNRLGYETYVLTPFNPASYNAQSAYEAMGVKQIRQPQNYGYPAPFNKNLWHISTADMMKYTRTLLETEPGDKPKAVFVLTMSEHGPYDTPAANAPALKNHQGEALSNLANYTARLLDSDKAITDFEDWVRSDPARRRMFVRFGDHQPAISYSDGYLTNIENPLFLTNFALVDSQLTAQEHYPVTDIVYLPGMIVERLAGKPSPFFQANIDARRLMNGAYVDAADKKLLESYRAYIFKDLKAADR